MASPIKMNDTGTKEMRSAGRILADADLLPQVFWAWKHYALPKRRLGELMELGTIPPQARTDQQVTKIMELLEWTHFFKQQKEDAVLGLWEEVCLGLSRILQLVCYDPNEEIYVQGEPLKEECFALFVVLYGQVDLLLVDPTALSTQRQHLSSVEAGKAFGDTYRLHEQETYHHTAVSGRDGPLWVVQCAKNDYINATKYTIAKENRLKLDFCCSLPVFRAISTTDLLDIVQHMTTIRFNRGEAVFRQGAEPSMIYFILDGEVELLKEVVLSMESVISKILTPAFQAELKQDMGSSKLTEHIKRSTHDSGQARHGVKTEKVSNLSALKANKGLESFLVRLARCVRGDVFGDIAVLDREMQPYSAVVTTKTVTCIAYSWTHFLQKIGGYMIENFKRFRLTYPNNFELKRLYNQAVQVSKRIGNNPVDVTVTHLRPQPRKNVLQSFYPDILHEKLEVTKADVRGYLRQPAKGKVKPTDVRVTASTSPTKSKQLSNDKATPDADPKDFGLVAAAKQVRLEYEEGNSLTQFLLGLPGKHALRRIQEKSVKSCEVLDISEENAEMRNLKYVELLEFACLVMVRLVNKDTQDHVESRLVDTVFEAWINHFSAVQQQDKARGQSFHAFRWTSEQFVVLVSTSDEKMSNVVSNVIHHISVMQELLRGCVEHMASQAHLLSQVIPEIKLAGGMAAGGLFTIISRLGRFVLDLAGECYEAALRMCKESTEGVICTDGIRQLASQTHTFNSRGSYYVIDSDIKFPYDHTFDTLYATRLKQKSREERQRLERTPHILSNSDAPVVPVPIHPHVEPLTADPNDYRTAGGAAFLHHPCPSPSTSESLNHLPALNSDMPDPACFAHLGRAGRMLGAKGSPMGPRAKSDQGPRHSNMTSVKFRIKGPSQVLIKGCDSAILGGSTIKQFTTKSGLPQGTNGTKSEDDNDHKGSRLPHIPKLRVPSMYVGSGKGADQLTQHPSPSADSPDSAGVPAGRREKWKHPSVIHELYNPENPSQELLDQLRGERKESLGGLRPLGGPKLMRKGSVDLAAMPLKGLEAQLALNPSPVLQPNKWDLGMDRNAGQGPSVIPQAPGMSSKWDLRGQLAVERMKILSTDESGYSASTGGHSFSPRQLKEQCGQKWTEHVLEASMATGSLTAMEDRLDLMDTLAPELCLSTGRLEGIPDMKRLMRLEVLAAGYNQIHRLLPETCHHHKYLRQLSLPFNRLTEVPEEIGNLRDLQDLNLGNNQISSLPESLGYLTELRVFVMHGNAQLKVLPESLGDLVNLQELHCGSCQLTRLPRELGQLTLLTQLQVANNRIRWLPKGLEALVKMKKFDVSRNCLTEFPQEVYSMTRIVELKLGHNQIPTMPKGIEAIKNTLQELELDSNQLVSIAADVNQLRQLQRLSCSGNKLLDLPARLNPLTSLTSLNAAQNQLFSLPKSTTTLTALQSLQVSENRLASLPDGLGSNMLSLRCLILTYNQLKTIPTSIMHATRLQVLSLDYNPLENPSQEIVRKGKEAIFAHLRHNDRTRAPGRTTEHFSHHTTITTADGTVITKSSTAYHGTVTSGPVVEAS